MLGLSVITWLKNCLKPVCEFMIKPYGMKRGNAAVMKSFIQLKHKNLRYYFVSSLPHVVRTIKISLLHE